MTVCALQHQRKRILAPRVRQSRHFHCLLPQSTNMGSPFTPTFRNIAYATGTAAGCVVCALLEEERFSPLIASFFGDVAATATIFAFSFAANNSCVYDAYWPAAPIPLAAYWLSLNRRPTVAAYTGFGLLAAWALRYFSIEVKCQYFASAKSKFIILLLSKQYLLLTSHVESDCVLFTLATNTTIQSCKV